MKKIIYGLCILGVTFLMCGCGTKNIEGTLPDIMEKLYAGISDEEMPMGVESRELDNDMLQGYFVEGTNLDFKYKEAIVSESMITAQAHAVVLIRLEDAKDADKVVENIKKNANPRKWICVEAENVYVLSKGDLVTLIMSNDLAPKIKENFENLK